MEPGEVGDKVRFTDREDKRPYVVYSLEIGVEEGNCWVVLEREKDDHTAMMISATWDILERIE